MKDWGFLDYLAAVIRGIVGAFSGAVLGGCIYAGCWFLSFFPGLYFLKVVGRDWGFKNTVIGCAAIFAIIAFLIEGFWDSAFDESDTNYPSSKNSFSEPVHDSFEDTSSFTYRDSMGYYRRKGEMFQDKKGYWYDPNDMYQDAEGNWRRPGDSYIDGSGAYRRPGEDFVDGSGDYIHVDRR